MDVDLRLYDFMEFPNLALRFSLASPHYWSGAPIFHQSKMLELLLRCFFLFGVLNLVYQNFGMIIYFFIGNEKDTDIEDNTMKKLETLLKISETGSTLGLVVVGVCKMWMLYGQRNRIRALLEEFENLFPNPRIPFEYSLYRIGHFAYQSRLLMKWTTVFFMFAFVYYNLQPLVELIYITQFTEEKFKYRFQSNTWYPWLTEHNRKSALSFVAAYICQIVASLTGVSFIMAGEFLLCFFTTQMQMHFEFLANALETLDASSPKANIRLKYLLAYHNRLLYFSKEINKIFNISFLVNFATSSVAICLMAFTMVMISGIYAFKYTIGLIVFLVFTLFICFNGSEFTASSNKLMPAAFYNNWYEGDPAYRKMILIFIMRAKEPNYLRAYKFNTVSMETYMAILKLSYRLFTFFRAMD